jgi:uncharacterized alpha-E superfamily protein
MLSRAADSLYWTARYVERAEDVGRLLHVNFHGLLDTPAEARGAAWRDLLSIVGADAVFAEHFPEPTPAAVTEFLLFHPANPDSVAVCVARARENARTVRERISSELWEHLNRMHFSVRDADRAAVLSGPHEFFVRLRRDSHTFQGLLAATMSRGEAYAFVELGAHIERADLTSRLLAVKVPRLEPDELVAVLKLCGAFEAFSKEHSAALEVGRVVEYLLTDRAFPRSVLFCLETCRRSVGMIASGAAPERTLGRLCAELSFYDVPAVPSESLRGFLGALPRRVAAAADEIAAAFFTMRVVVPGAFARAEQQ